jgi:hypothetical protein
MSLTLHTLEETADALLTAATNAEITLRLMGSIGVFKVVKGCPLWPKLCPDKRVYHDIDFAASFADFAKVSDLFPITSWNEDRNVELQTDGRRLRFVHNQLGLHADVFFDRIEANHTIDLRGRLNLCQCTLSPSDLLLSKLQRVNLRAVDRQDIACLLAALKIEACDTAIDASYIAQVLSRNWGFYHTVTLALDDMCGYVASASSLTATERNYVAAAIARLRGLIEGEQKSIRWRLRSRFGPRLRWYHLVEAPLGF